MEIRKDGYQKTWLELGNIFNCVFNIKNKKLTNEGVFIVKRFLMFFTLIAISICFFTIQVLAVKEDPTKFEEYRKAIKSAYNIDIKKFKDKLKGGRADGKAITKYDLQQLIMGIEVELEHTKDKMTALEIATDHLEEIPDYYTRLLKMEKEAEEEIEMKAKN